MRFFSGKYAQLESYVGWQENCNGMLADLSMWTALEADSAVLVRLFYFERQCTCFYVSTIASLEVIFLMAFGILHTACSAEYSIIVKHP